MVLVHGHGAEAALPEVARAALARVDMAGVTATDRRQGPAQPIRVGREEDHVHMVRHQHPGPDLDAGRPAGSGQKVTIEGVVLVAEKGLRPPVAALGHVVGQAGDDNAGQTSHAVKLGLAPSPCQLNALSP
jgi:hypothetical protein